MKYGHYYIESLQQRNNHSTASGCKQDNALQYLDNLLLLKKLELNLDYIVDNPWIVLPCSALMLMRRL
jgi:hypothetical protein